MGLKSGDKGAKAVLKLQHAAAFRRFGTLSEVRDGVRFPDPNDPEPAAMRACTREETAVFVDGNVLMMAIPQDVLTLDAWVDIIFGYIRNQAMAAGKLVVVVFDEPEHMTWAKKEEQRRRDASLTIKKVACSADIAPPPLPINFTRAELEAVANVGALKKDRLYKARIFDEVIKRVYERLLPIMDRWRANGHDPGVLVLDGVEVRGCELPEGERRAPVVLASDPEAATAFARTSPIGEGDIKLIQLENRLRELKALNERYADYKLALTWTIDTDSFMTMLLDVSKRRITPYPGALHSLFCMREAAPKRDRDADTASARASFLTCDTVLLEYKLQCHMWADASERPTPQMMLHSMLALCASAALCGCDFTCKGGTKGARFDHFWESFPSFVAQEPKALASFGSVLADDCTVARTSTQGLLRVCYAASAHMEEKKYSGTSNKTYKAQAKEVFEVGDTMLRKAIWTAAYWGQQEFEADQEWGFAPDLSVEAMAQAQAQAQE